MNWGIVGTGTIANTLAMALSQTDRATLTAVASRSRSSAVGFATKHGITHAHDSTDALLANDDVDVVYIATPHPNHAEVCLQALQSGKHVLCEKPLGMNHAEVMAATYTAQKQSAFLMEAFMYRCHPQTDRIKALVDSGAIGDVRHMEAQFGYNASVKADSRLFANALGGGGILDVGCYPVSMARLILGEPTTVDAHGHIGATGVDEWSSASLRFEQGTTANVTTGVRVLLDNTVTIYGSKGRIFVSQPWLPGDEHGRWSFEVHTPAGVTVESGQAKPLYVLEIEAVEDAIAGGAIQCPSMTFEDSRGNARVLDAWRTAIQLKYEQEAHPGKLSLPPSTPSAKPIPTSNVAHLDKPGSRLLMGCDNQPNLNHASAMWDHFVDAGGNTFDTAYVYGGGVMERYLGAWHTARGVRNEINIIGKGAHTPHCSPEHIASQLDESLERLQTDYVDIYFLHRDNTDIPVGEFVDALNEQVSAGRIKALGGSNWTLDRVKALNDYAAHAHKQGFAAISNNFSLARMVRRIWPGVEAVTEQAYLDYLTDTQTALFPWSSQARGFFTPWAGSVIEQRGKEQVAVTTMQPTIAELEHTWFSDDNLARRERAGELAEELGTSMINVALAYVLTQNFPTFALVGPRLLEETDSCIEALSLNLSSDQVRWLENG